MKNKRLSRKILLENLKKASISNANLVIMKDENGNYLSLEEKTRRIFIHLARIVIEDMKRGKWVKTIDSGI